MIKKYSKAESTLNRILDAAFACYSEHGIARTTLDQVAKFAGVGRTTLYRYVNNRDDLLNKVILRDAKEQQEEMSVVTRYHDNLADSIVDSIIYIMRGRRTRPVNAILFGDGAIMDHINVSPASFYEMAEKMLEPLFFKAQGSGEIRPGVTLPQVSQWVARVILSLINYPEEFLNDELALREFLMKFLVPSIVVDSG